MEKCSESIKVVKTSNEIVCLAGKKLPKLYAKMIMVQSSETDIKDNEGYRQKGIGRWYDATILANWPIPLDEINARV